MKSYRLKLNWAALLTISFTLLTNALDRVDVMQVEQRTSIVGCGAENNLVNASVSGTLTSPNHPQPYPPSCNMTWQLVGEPGVQFQVFVFLFDLEDSVDCFKDGLYVNGEGPFCGNLLPLAGQRFDSGDANMTVNFYSDGLEQFSGFHLIYIPVTAMSDAMVGERDATVPGLIFSPWFGGGYYPDDTKCFWVITAPQGNYILFRILSFDIQNDDRDFVDLYGNYKLIYSFSELEKSVDPYFTVTFDSPLLIYFRSDSDDNSGTGFRFGYSISPVQHYTSLSNRSIVVDEGITSSVNHMTFDFYPISTTNYLLGQNYNSNERMFWDIQVTSSYAVHLEFLYFSLEYDGVCGYDSVIVVDLLSQVYGPYCGSPQMPLNVTSEGNRLIVLFTSDADVVFPGFLAVYSRTVSGSNTTEIDELGIDLNLEQQQEPYICHETLLRDQGEFTSLGFQHGISYQHNHDCVYTIQGRGEGWVVHLWFLAFQLESHSLCAYDWVLVVLGPGYEFKYCGSELPGGGAGLTSLNSTVVVRFHTDYSVHDLGFHAAYETRNVSAEALEEIREELDIMLYGYECGGPLDDAEGFLASPGYIQREDYPPFANCTWVITVQNGSYVHIVFQAFDLEVGLGTICYYDYVMLYDEVGEIGRFCGSAIPAGETGITSRNNTLWVKMFADNVIEAAGFLAMYDTVNVTYDLDFEMGCSDDITVEGPGTISSPGFTQGVNYGNNLDCTWTLTAELGFYIFFMFETIELEYQSSCLFDYVIIEDTSGQLLKTCGSEGMSEAITTVNNTAWVFFHSDHTVTRSGFQLHYTRVNESDNLPGSQDSAVKCTELPTGAVGAVWSPAFFDTLSYQGDLSCLWFIEGPPGSVVELRISYLSIPFKPNCPWTYVSVFPIVPGGYIYCGTYVALTTFEVVTFNTSVMTVIFVANEPADLGGFYASYAILEEETFENTNPLPQECGGEMTQLSGVVASPGFLQGQNYPANTECTWLINLDEGFYVYIRFRRFRLQHHADCSRDFLRVFLGDAILNTYCGGALPGGAHGIMSDSNQMRLFFRSDGHVGDMGFMALYGISLVPGQPGGTTPGMFTCANGAEIALSGQCDGIFNCIDASDESVDHAACMVPGGFRDCGGQILAAEEEKYIYTPGFLSDENYPNNALCEWEIEGFPGTVIHVFFNTFNLEIHDECLFDYIKVYDNTTLVSRFCGIRSPGGDLGIMSTTHIMKIVFFADSQTNYDGFYATVTSQSSGTLEAGAWGEYFYCSNGVQVQFIYTCDGGNDCGDMSDESPELAGCEEMFNCTDGQLIPLYQLCDGIKQCHNGRDESVDDAGCEDLFVCSDGEILPGSWVCDSFNDCIDGGDEMAEGANCEVFPCQNEPCFHNGTCVPNGDIFSCRCAGVWGGPTCQLDMVDNCINASCANGATCVDRYDTYFCLCKTGYFGQFCETELSGESMNIYVARVNMTDARTSRNRNISCGISHDDPCDSLGIAAALSQRGGTVHFLAGHYAELDLFWLSRSISFIGESRDTTFLNLSSVVITDASDTGQIIEVSMEGLTLSGEMYVGDVSLTLHNCILQGLRIQQEYTRRQPTHTLVMTISLSEIYFSQIITRPPAFSSIQENVMYSCYSATLLISETNLDNSLINITAVETIVRLDRVTVQHNDKGVMAVGVHVKPGVYFQMQDENEQSESNKVAERRKRSATDRRLSNKFPYGSDKEIPRIGHKRVERQGQHSNGRYDTATHWQSSDNLVHITKRSAVFHKIQGVQQRAADEDEGDEYGERDEETFHNIPAAQQRAAEEDEGEDDGERDEDTEEESDQRPVVEEEDVAVANDTVVEEEEEAQEVLETNSVIELRHVVFNGIETTGLRQLSAACLTVEALDSFTVLLEQTSFTNTTRGVSIRFSEGTTSTVIISDSNFTGNHAVGPGAGIRVDQINGRMNVNIQDCIFEDNYAVSLQSATSDVADDAEVTTTDASQIAGSGGAVAISLAGSVGLGSQCIVELNDCEFNNNTAENYGGSVYLTSGVLAHLTRNNFQSADYDVTLRPLVGDLLESRGDVVLNNNTFMVRSAFNEVPVISYRADEDGAFLESYDLHFLCPIGFSALPVYSAIEASQSRVPIETLLIYCNSCDDGEYSLETSQVIIDQQNGLEVTEVNNATCLTCPYGAQCMIDVQSKANFWGENYNGEIHMYLCPEGYCCQELLCQDYSECAEDRVGKMCGRCRDGYSESLFSTDCIPNTDCTYATYFWFVIALYGIFFVLFFVFEQECDILVKVFSTWVMQKLDQLLKTLGSCRRDSVEQSPKPPQTIRLRESYHRVFADPAMSLAPIDVSQHPGLYRPPDSLEDLTEDQAEVQEGEEEEGAFLQIFMYYVQVPSLLTLQILYKNHRDQPLEVVTDAIKNIFSFNTFGINLNTCLFPGVTAVFKTWMQAAYILFLFVLWFIFYIIGELTQLICGPCSCGFMANVKMRARFTGALVMLLLYTYQHVAENGFILLRCMSMESEPYPVLFIDANVYCYQAWQWGILAFACIYIFPFSVVLAYAPSLLRWRAISVRIFIISIILPLFSCPFLVFMFYKHRERNHGKRKHTASQTMGTVDVIVDVIFEPYRNYQQGGLCWEGMIALRRLVLVLLSTLVENIMIRHIGLAFACLGSLLLHVWITPFAKRSCNVIENISLTILLMVSIMNLLKAVYFESGEIPDGIPDRIFYYYDWIEAAVLGLVPLGIGIFASVAVFVRFADLIRSCCVPKPRMVPQQLLMQNMPADGPNPPRYGMYGMPLGQFQPLLRQSQKTWGQSRDSIMAQIPPPDYTPACATGEQPKRLPRVPVEKTTHLRAVQVGGRWGSLLNTTNPESPYATVPDPSLYGTVPDSYLRRQRRPSDPNVDSPPPPATSHTLPHHPLPIYRGYTAWMEQLQNQDI